MAAETYFQLTLHISPNPCYKCTYNQNTNNRIFTQISISIHKLGTADKILDFGKDLGRVHQERKADKARDAYHMHHAGSDYKDLLIDPAFLIID